MVEYLYGADDVLISWARERIEGMMFDADAKAIGVARGHEIVGCAVFDAFTTSGCQIAVASDGKKRWLTHEYIVRVFTIRFCKWACAVSVILFRLTTYFPLNLCGVWALNRKGLFAKRG